MAVQLQAMATEEVWEVRSELQAGLLQVPARGLLLALQVARKVTDMEEVDTRECRRIPILDLPKPPQVVT